VFLCSSCVPNKAESPQLVASCYFCLVDHAARRTVESFNSMAGSLLTSSLLQAGGTAAVQSLCAAVAAGGTDQLHSQDPALDSLIDRWLSHKHASTSAPGQTGRNGSSSRRQQLQQQQSLQQDWEGLLGPVSVTMTSLATLEVCSEAQSQTLLCWHVGVCSGLCCGMQHGMCDICAAGADYHAGAVAAIAVQAHTVAQVHESAFCCWLCAGG
jgi:hypothetical protein